MTNPNKFFEDRMKGEESLKIPALISYIFKGEGKFKRTLEFVGYGYIPMIFSGIIFTTISFHLCRFQ